MNDQKNTILAIVLSAHRADRLADISSACRRCSAARSAADSSAATAAAAPPPAAPAPARSPARSAARAAGAGPDRRAGRAAHALSRERSLKQSARIADRHAAAQGLDRAQGRRASTTSRSTQYRETVDPNSPAIVLLSPSGSPHPFYAEFGWVGAAGAPREAARTPDTVWKQEGSGALRPDQPVTLVYDNGEGLAFRRTIAVDDKYLFTLKDEVANNGVGAGDALSLCADLAPRHAADARLLHPARGPDRRISATRACRRSPTRRSTTRRRSLQRHQCLARHHRQVLGGDAAARHQGAMCRRTSPPARSAR